MWGVFCAIAALMVFNVLDLHHRDPMRPGWLWDTEITRRLFWTGAPIMLNSAIYTVMMSLDRILLLSLGSNGAEAAGLYSVAWMGTSWCLDFSGRISLVMYTYFQRTIGRTGAPTEVAQQVVQVVEAIAAPLAAGLAVAYVVGPTFLGFIVPRYTEGLPAIRPLLPGVLLLGLARPIREAMIAVGRPIPLAICSIPGLMIAAALGANAAREGEIVALSFGLSLGYAVFYLAISLAFVAREQGFRPWLFHQGRLSRTILWYVTGALLAAHLPLGLENSRWFDFGARVMLLALWGLPGLVLWGKSYSWGGLYRGRPSTRKVED